MNAASPRGLLVLTRFTLRKLKQLQDRLLHLLGSTVEGRPQLVARMLERNANEATSYWLQLCVSIGIATLGLVVGSVAVIIGAMLVAPLMGPIVALAMGLAAGSPFLVLRSAVRILLSMAVTVVGAALITLLLPFHELNAEIAARTSPTVLDLLTAGFCALAGVYASLRPGSDTATTAAGTSIGISLVPPLCASGYGIGTAAWSVAGGAALLFLTNLVAIVVVGTLAFVAAGFNRVDSAGLEREELAKNQRALVTAAVAKRLAGLFESGAGPALRFLMPLALLAAVYLPLRRALDEVAWQVRVRAAVQHSLDREQLKIVERRVRVERHEVDLLLVLLGKTDDAEASRTRLETEIKSASGVVPRIEVLAIPDAKAFAGLESTLRRSEDALPIVHAKPPPSPGEQLASTQAWVRSTVTRLWPAGTAGDPLIIEIGTSQDDPLPIRVVHLGAPLGLAAVESLRRAIGLSLAREVELVDATVPAGPLKAEGSAMSFVAQVASALRLSTPIADLVVCVVEPEPAARRKRVDANADALGATLHELLGGHPRVKIERGDAWQIEFVRGECGAAPAVGAASIR